MTNKKGMSTVEAGMIGAAAGFAVGATLVALSSEETRDKVEAGVEKVKKLGKEAYSDMKAAVEEVASKGETKVKAAKQTLKSKVKNI